MVDGLAIENGTGSSRIIPDHASQGSAAAAGSVGTKQKSVRTQIAVQLILYDARLDSYPPLFRIKLQNVIHVLGKIQMNGMAHSLSRKTGATAPGQDRQNMADGCAHGRQNILSVPGDHNADRVDAVDTGIGA